jgi:DNA-binding MarR family transcriptional regulator
VSRYGLLMRDWIDEQVERWGRQVPELDPLAEAIVTRLHVLARELTRHKQAILTEYGLEVGQWKTLRDLRALGEPYAATPTELATLASLSPAAMTKRLDGLEAAGHITRGHEPGDRRRVTVRLTEQGQAAFAATIAGRDVHEKQLLAGLSQEQREQLAGLLRILVIGAGNPER